MRLRVNAFCNGWSHRFVEQSARIRSHSRQTATPSPGGPVHTNMDIIFFFLYRKLKIGYSSQLHTFCSFSIFLSHSLPLVRIRYLAFFNSWGPQPRLKKKKNVFMCELWTHNMNIYMKYLYIYVICGLHCAHKPHNHTMFELTQIASHFCKGYDDVNEIEQ